MNKKSNFIILCGPLIGFLIVAALILFERMGVQYQLQANQKDFVPVAVMTAAKPAQETECLLLYDSKSAYNYRQNIAFVLKSMCVGYKTLDVQTESLPDLNEFKTVVVALTNLDLIKRETAPLIKWVSKGGRVLFACTLEPNVTMRGLYKDLGVRYETVFYTSHTDFKMVTGLLPGGKGNTYNSGVGGSSSTLGVQLSDDCTVHMESADESKTPMLWEHALGNGKVIVNNNDSFVRKESRGLIAAAYSLLQDVFAYPVINASMFFIEDFPAPVPQGNNESITAQYHTDLKGYYTNIWFPDMMSLAKRYGLKYTGMIVETYNTTVAPPFGSGGDELHKYFGGQLLKNGFEIGLHGYNHQSLVLENFDYQGVLGYAKWQSTADMAEATKEAVRFAKEMFPNLVLKTYVPPSDVLSSEGRAMLKENFPQINTISGVFVDYLYGQDQEFGVGEDGLIDLPRISKGYRLSDSSRWVALNEIGFQYINSYSLYPGDVLDPMRSGGRNWDEMKKSLSGYLQWLYSTAYGIRNLTAQEGAMAVQRYSNLTLMKTAEEGKLIIDIGGFYDEAWLLVRFNEGNAGFVEGGTIEHVGDGLYLLHATEDHVVVIVER